MELSVSSLEVHTLSGAGGTCLRSAIAVKAGAVLARFGGTEAPAPARHTIQIDIARHIDLEPECLRYTNHSCDPNVGFDMPRRLVIALRDLRAGEELQYFYPSTEWQMAEPFACHCKSPHCVGLVRGAADLDPLLLARHSLAPHIHTLLQRRADAGQ